MSRRIICRIILTLLLISVLTLIFNIQPVKAVPKIIVVPDEFSSIQEAVNYAEEGDTIYVRTGTYNGTVVINKQVSLMGENRDTTVIDKGVIIEADDVIVNGFTISNNYSADNAHGIWVKGSKCLISNNNLIACRFEGIFLDGGASENVVTNNYILNNRDCGVLVWGGNNNYIGINSITNNFVGVYVYDSASMNQIKRNEIVKNLDAGVVIDWFSSDNSVIKNNISDNGWRGFIGLCGIDLMHSDFNRIISNNILNNKRGIRFLNAENNNLYHNSFINNTEQIYVNPTPAGPSINVLDDSYPSGGNYWSDYTGVDLYSGPYQNVTGSDGIGDAPYIIDMNNRDRYPFMQSYKQLICDLNEDDEVDMKDLRIVALSFASYPGHPRWNPDADIDQDGHIDMADIRLVAKNFGKTYRQKP